MQAKPARFKCDQCANVYTRKVNLLDHIQTTHSEAPVKYPCGKCSKTFARKSDRDRHQRVQHGEHRYVCGQRPQHGGSGCGKAFARSDALREHRLTKKCAAHTKPQAPVVNDLGAALFIVAAEVVSDDEQEDETSSVQSTASTEQDATHQESDTEDHHKLHEQIARTPAQTAPWLGWFSSSKDPAQPVGSTELEMINHNLVGYLNEKHELSVLSNRASFFFDRDHSRAANRATFLEERLVSIGQAFSVSIHEPHQHERNYRESASQLVPQVQLKLSGPEFVKIIHQILDYFTDEIVKPHNNDWWVRRACDHFYKRLLWGTDIKPLSPASPLQYLYAIEFVHIYATRVSKTSDEMKARHPQQSSSMNTIGRDYEEERHGINTTTLGMTKNLTQIEGTKHLEFQTLPMPSQQLGVKEPTALPSPAADSSQPIAAQLAPVPASTYDYFLDVSRSDRDYFSKSHRPPQMHHLSDPSDAPGMEDLAMSLTKDNQPSRARGMDDVLEQMAGTVYSRFETQKATTDVPPPITIATNVSLQPPNYLSHPSISNNNDGDGVVLLQAAGKEGSGSFSRASDMPRTAQSHPNYISGSFRMPTMSVNRSPSRQGSPLNQLGNCYSVPLFERHERDLDVRQSEHLDDAMIVGTAREPTSTMLASRLNDAKREHHEAGVKARQFLPAMNATTSFRSLTEAYNDKLYSHGEWAPCTSLSAKAPAETHAHGNNTGFQCCGVYFGALHELLSHCKLLHTDQIAVA